MPTLAGAASQRRVRRANSSPVFAGADTGDAPPPTPHPLSALCSLTLNERVENWLVCAYGEQRLHARARTRTRTHSHTHTDTHALAPLLRSRRPSSSSPPSFPSLRRRPQRHARRPGQRRGSGCSAPTPARKAPSATGRALRAASANQGMARAGAAP